MANEIWYVILKKEDGTYSGFKALKDDLERAEPGRWLITLRKYRKSRSNAQNSYYHGIVVQCVMDGLVAMGFERRELSARDSTRHVKRKVPEKEFGQ